MERFSHSWDKKEVELRPHIPPELIETFIVAKYYSGLTSIFILAASRCPQTYIIRSPILEYLLYILNGLSVHFGARKYAYLSIKTGI